jgi:hypothetical protein
VAIAFSRLVRRNVNGTAGQSGKKSVHLLDVHSILAAEGFENTAQGFEFSIAQRLGAHFTIRLHSVSGMPHLSGSGNRWRLKQYRDSSRSPPRDISNGCRDATTANPDIFVDPALDIELFVVSPPCA